MKTSKKKTILRPQLERDKAMAAKPKSKRKSTEFYKHVDMIITRILMHIPDIPSPNGQQRCKNCLENICDLRSGSWEPGCAIIVTYNKKGKVISRINQENAVVDVWAKARQCKDMYIQ